MIHTKHEIASLWNEIETRDKEIESLRSDYENVCQDIELQNKQMMEWYADKRRAEDDRDEWKRRAEIMWRSLERIPGNALGVMYDDLPDDEPNWFEEDKNNG